MNVKEQFFEQQQQQPSSQGLHQENILLLLGIEPGGKT